MSGPDTPFDPMSADREPKPPVSGAPAEPSPYQTHLNRTAEEEARADAARTARPSSLLDFGAHWRALSAKQQLRVKQAGIGLAIALLGYGLYTASSASKSHQSLPANATKLDMGAGLRGDSLETKLHGDLQAIRDGQQQLAGRVSAIEEGKVTPGSKAGTTSHDMGDLPAALPNPDVPASPPVSAHRGRGQEGSEVDSLPAPPAGSSASAPPAPPAPPVLKTVGAIGAATSSIVPAAGGGAGGGKDGGSDFKKRTGRSFYRLVS